MSRWPLTRSCYSRERAEAKYGRAETGTGSRPTCAVGPKPGMAPTGSGWGWEGAGPPGSLIVGTAEPQDRWHQLWMGWGQPWLSMWAWGLIQRSAGPMGAR